MTYHLESGDQVNTVEYNGSHTVKSFTKSRHILSGYAIASGGEKVYSVGDIISNIKNDVELYPIWTFNPKITYHKEDGDEVVDVTYNGSHATKVLSKDGWKFLGYSITPDGDVVYSKGQTISNIKTDIELYPKWERITHTLTYHLESGDQAVTKNEGESVSLPTQSKANHTFEGYATQAGGSVVYRSGASLIMDA